MMVHHRAWDGGGSCAGRQETPHKEPEATIPWCKQVLGYLVAYFSFYGGK